MKITIESTEKIVDVNGVPARIWEGQTESGIPVHCFVTRIAVHKDDPRQEEFQKELLEQKTPSMDVQGYPLRLII
jgi:hypothetical protein